MRPRNHRAVMGSRKEAKTSRDMFPTPAFATRALLKHVVARHIRPSQTVLDPCCGRGHMTEPILEFFDTVYATDIHDYGYGEVADFLDPAESWPAIDLVVANPPFNLWIEFALKALELSRVGVALFAPLRQIEGITRYQRLYRDNPPTYFAPFCERVTLLRNRVDLSGRTATAYCWIVWIHAARRHNQLVHIPPGRRLALASAEDLQLFGGDDGRLRRRSP